MKIVFLGTPKFAIPSLEKLLESNHEILAVITPPDKPAKRGQKLLPCCVKEWALEKKLQIQQFTRISRDGIKFLEDLKPDIIITVAYGQILSQQVLDIPRYGVINVHPSLLPKYRGASPIQTAIIKGETVTGITIMQTNVGMDSGDILKSETFEILPNQNAGELSDELSEVGAKMLLEVLSDIEAGNINPIKQNHSDATFTTKIDKEDCSINWNKSAKQIHDLVRGANPEPIAYSVVNKQVLKIYSTEIVTDMPDTKSLVGTVIKESSAKAGVFIQCGNGILKLNQVQFPGGKVLDARNLMNGRKINVGDVFEYIVQVNN